MGGCERIGDLAGDRRPALAGGLQVGDRVQQHARVGVLRSGEDLVRRPQLREPAQVHDADPVGDVVDDGEVVGDEEVGQPELPLQVLHEVQDLRLHRDVQGRGRLVANHELRVARQRARDRDSLALAARELVRVRVGVGGRQADLGEQGVDALASSGPTPATRR